MAEVHALNGLRYDERVAGPLDDLISPPYDVISSEGRAALAARSERNVVHVELPEPTRDGYGRAAEALRRWRAEGALAADESSLYLHEHVFMIGGRRLVRNGVFVALRLYPSSAGVVLPHELTFPKAKADRLELLRATRTNISPIFGMVDGSVMRVLDDARRSAPQVARATLGDDAHTLRRLSDRAVIARFVEAMRDEHVYLADGHHRYETALTYADERGAPEDAPERFVLTYLCALDDPGLRIFATHRIVTGATTALDDAVARSFETSRTDRGVLGDVQPGIVVARDGRFTRLALRASIDVSSMPAAWRELPVALAEQLLVRPALDAGAEIAYEHDLERAIDAGTGGRTSILLRAVDPPTLRAVADAGQRLPQKTTYFYPKVPAGLVLRSLDLG